MTVVRGTELGAALSKTLVQINAQITAVENLAAELECQPYEVKDTRGTFVMAPLLAAKAQCLHALVLINQRRN